MKKYIFISLLTLILGCTKNAINPSGAGASSTYHDSTLLFALNVIPNGFNDSSIYKNTTVITAMDTIVTDGGRNCIEFGGDAKNGILQYLTNNLPIGKISNNLSIFLDVKNGKTGSGSEYSDSTSYFTDIGIGPIGVNPLAINFILHLENYNGIPSSLFMEWKTPSDNCDISSAYTGQINDIPNPISTANYAKLVITISQDIISFYVNGALRFQSANQYPISLTNCFSPSSYIGVYRGTIIRDFKIWNRALTQSEISNL
ncbi:MAG: hypothetical protein KGM16_12375 [Bacteroidota bacterium]|nr:hypothetical protein [Bacteroidota bacterium]